MRQLSSSEQHTTECREPACNTLTRTFAHRPGCEKAYDNAGQRDIGEFATASECGGWIEFNFESSVEIGKMNFQQRWAEVDWSLDITLTFSDGTTQAVQLEQTPELTSYTLQPVMTDSVRITFETMGPNAGETCNNGAKEIQFFQAGDTPYGCYIGLEDGFRDGRQAWSDGSTVEYVNWAAGEPNGGQQENYAEMDFRIFGRCDHGADGYDANHNNGCENIENRAGTWNDGSGTNPMYFICEDSSWEPEIEYTYVGCYHDGAEDGTQNADGSPRRSFNGVNEAGAVFTNGNTADPYFQLGDDASPARCAQECQGFRYMAIQDGGQCFCDNAGGLDSIAPEADCNMECAGEPGTMCGGPWRNSVYELGSSYWENAGFDDSSWEAASDLGFNGVGPWYKRPQISDEAKWIWSNNAEAAGHTFCRFVEPNREINCYAAQSQYWEDYPSVRDQSYPAWNHFNDVGRRAGNIWHSELCNTCAAGDYQHVCRAAQTGECLDGGGNPIPGCIANAQGTHSTPSTVGQVQCDTNLCTNKCRGLHDAFDADVVGAVVQKVSGAYGKGIANFINPRADTVTFNLVACNAGAHKLGFSYALADDNNGQNQRPLVVTVNGVNAGPIDRRTGQHQSLRFPETGSWTDWGEVFIDVQLAGGENTVVLTPDPTVGQSGANINFMRVFPVDDYDSGTARFNFDNSGAFYVNEVLIGGGDGSWNPDGTLHLGAVTGWDKTNTWTFQADCSVPTVYSVHGMDYEVTTDGLGGIIGEITHCGEVITTGARWKCTASDMPGLTQAIVAQWKSADFDDSTWEIAGEFGVPSSAPDATAGQWMWTIDQTNHNDVFCRIVSKHQPVNCKDAADRYEQDYPEILSQRDASKLAPYAHFNQFGRLEGRIWHSELCDAKCGYVAAPYHWVDAQANGIEADKSTAHGGTPPYNSNLDDGYFDIELPFAFPFFGQRKHQAKVSTNGYLTFSGGHSECTAPNRAEHDCGASYALPGVSGTYGNGGVVRGPTDMIAVYWTDLDFTNSGSLHTYTIDPAAVQGGQDTTSCAYGIAAGGWTAGAGMSVGEGEVVGQACCASSCGQCGGGGCDQFPGGVEACCTQHVHMNAPSCAETGGVGPCNINERAFVIECECCLRGALASAPL